MPQAQLTDEMIRNIQSKAYRMNNFYYITTKEGDMVRFAANAVQKHYFKNRTLRDIILKSRQHGVTTWACLDELDEALFNPCFEGLIIAQDDSTMQAIFDKVHLAFLNHPLMSQWQIDTQRANQLKVGFLDGDEKGTSKSFSSVMVKQSGRSGTFHYVHISEYGKICAKFPHKVKEIKSGTFKGFHLKEGFVLSLLLKEIQEIFTICFGKLGTGQKISLEDRMNLKRFFIIGNGTKLILRR